jgi:TolB-like protein
LLAVLPLQNLSNDPNQEYFSDGTTEALIGNLVQIRALKVIRPRSLRRADALGRRGAGDRAGDPGAGDAE